jgi:hypothetical protein
MVHSRRILAPIWWSTKSGEFHVPQVEGFELLYGDPEQDPRRDLDPSDDFIQASAQIDAVLLVRIHQHDDSLRGRIECGTVGA